MSDSNQIVFNDEKTENKIFSKKNIIVSIVILLIIATILRIPYTTTFIDSYIFEYLFGFAKFFIYLFILVLLFLILFKKQQILLKKRYIIAIILFYISFSLFLSSFYHLLENKVDTLKNYVSLYNKNFKIYANKYSDYNQFLNNYYSGGIIFEIIYGYIQEFIPIVLIFFSIIIFLICINIIANKKIFKLKKTNKPIAKLADDVEFKKNKINFNNAVDVVQIRSDVMNDHLTIPSIEYLADENIDSNIQNKSIIDKYQEIIIDFFNKNNLPIKFKEQYISYVYSEIVFVAATVGAINEVINNKLQIGTLLGVSNYILVIKDKTIIFEFANKELSYFSFKEIEKNVIKRQNIVPVGKTIEDKLLTFNSKENNLITITGRNGSGVSTLLSTILLSSMYNNNPNDLGIYIFSNTKTPLINCFQDFIHVNKNVFYYQNTIIEDINNLISTITNAKKQIIVVIENYDELCENDDIKKSICSLSDVIKQYNHLLILKSNGANLKMLEFYKKANISFVFKVSNDESEMIMQSTRGGELWEKGDGYFYENETKTRFQTCYLNIKEIEFIKETINTFFNDLQNFSI